MARIFWKNLRTISQSCAGRRGLRHGDAASSVTAAKQARLISAAQLWLAAHPRHAQRPCRFDVVCYDGPVEGARMSWWRDAFQAG